MRIKWLKLCQVIILGITIGISPTYSTVVSLAESQTAQATFSFGNVTGYSGDEVCVPLKITNNPGIAAFCFRIEYDAEALTPISVEKGSLLTKGFLSSKEEEDRGAFTFLWYHTGNIQGDGELAVIRFKVSAAADGEYPLTVKYIADDICNAALETIPCLVQNGSVCVEPKLTHISLELPNKRSYWEGEALDLTGMTVTAHFQNNTTKEVFDYTCTGYDSKPGTKIITISWRGMTSTFEVEVKAVKLSSIKLTTMPTKTTYLEGKESFDPTGGKVTLTYNNGSSEVIELTSEMISGFDNTKVGKQILTVTYGNFTDTFEIEIIAYLPGDVNGDNNVNMKDYSLFRQYLSGWEVKIESAVADVNGDNTINLKDLALLRQWLNGWDVELH